MEDMDMRGVPINDKECDTMTHVIYLQCKREDVSRYVGPFKTVATAREWGEKYAHPLFAFWVKHNGKTPGLETPTQALDNGIMRPRNA